MNVEIKVNERAKPVTNTDGSTTRKIPFAYFITSSDKVGNGCFESGIDICNTNQALSIYSKKTDTYYEIDYSDIVMQIIEHEKEISVNECS